MNLYKIGSILEVDEIRSEIIGYVIYRNPDDYNKKWVEYRLKTSEGEKWLSIDEEYGEYSISSPSYLNKGQIPHKFNKVDEGTQIVVEASGDVDVERGDSAKFIEYEDATEEEILSVEMWDDGTEISEGYYLDREEIVYVGGGARNDSNYEKKSSSLEKFNIFGYVFIILFAVSIFLIDEGFIDLSRFFDSPPRIEQYMKKTPHYHYKTSITGREDQKADVYSYNKIHTTAPTTDIVAKDIIDGIYGETEVVTENADNKDDGSIAILTKEEYCLIYYPDVKDADTEQKSIYVQVSNRKYNYTSLNSPYRARYSTNMWYKTHYYSSGYKADSTKWSSTPSAYRMYDGPIMKDLGNGYYDVYSNNIRMSSVNRRNSDSGGFSKGK